VLTIGTFVFCNSLTVEKGAVWFGSFEGATPDEFARPLHLLELPADVFAQMIEGMSLITGVIPSSPFISSNVWIPGHHFLIQELLQKSLTKMREAEDKFYNDNVQPQLRRLRPARGVFGC